MRETVQQKQSIMSIMPDLIAKQLNQNPLPVAPSRQKDSNSINKPPLLRSVEETQRDSLTSATTVRMKSSNGASKASSAASTSSRPSRPVTNKKVSDSQRSVHGAPVLATRAVPFSGDRKPEGAVKAAAVSRPNPLSCGTGASELSIMSTSIRPKISSACQNGCPRAPLKDRSNSSTKAVRK